MGYAVFQMRTENVRSKIGDMFYSFYKFVRSWTDSPSKIENKRVDSIPEVNNNEIGFAIEDEPVY